MGLSIADLGALGRAAKPVVLLLLGMGAGVLSIVVPRLLGRFRYRIVSVTLNLPFGLGNVVYEPTDQDRVLAWRLYVQLKTRKAALIFDDANDVIADVYDSLYELFAITRSLLSDLPVSEAARPEGVAALALRVLNDGIRPHLTKWQAAFRRWWKTALELPENERRAPQDVQCDYPHYYELTDELKQMNEGLVRYAEDLLAIVRARAHRREAEERPEAERPAETTTTTTTPAPATTAVEPVTPYLTSTTSTTTTADTTTTAVG